MFRCRMKISFRVNHLFILCVYTSFIFLKIRHRCLSYLQDCWSGTPSITANSYSPPLLRVCADGLQGGDTNNQQGGCGDIKT